MSGREVGGFFRSKHYCIYHVRDTAGIEKPHAVLTIDRILRQFDKQRRRQRRGIRNL